ATGARAARLLEVGFPLAHGEHGETVGVLVDHQQARVVAIERNGGRVRGRAALCQRARGHETGEPQGDRGDGTVHDLPPRMGVTDTQSLRPATEVGSRGLEGAYGSAAATGWPRRASLTPPAAPRQARGGPRRNTGRLPPRAS